MILTSLVSNLKEKEGFGNQQRQTTPEGWTETHKSSFFSFKQVSDHEWFRMTKAFILCDLLWKIPKRHAVNREGSFKIV